CARERDLQCLLCRGHALRSPRVERRVRCIRGWPDAPSPCGALGLFRRLYDHLLRRRSSCAYWLALASGPSSVLTTRRSSSLMIFMTQPPARSPLTGSIPEAKASFFESG